MRRYSEVDDQAGMREDIKGEWVRLEDIEHIHTLAKELNEFYPGPFPSLAVRRLIKAITELK